MRANIVQILKATLAAVIFSLACVLAFSLVMQLFSLSASAVKPVNQVIKILAIAAGGVLPRKTFSMGEANEKRYYLECRKIK